MATHHAAARRYDAHWIALAAALGLAACSTSDKGSTGAPGGSSGAAPVSSGGVSGSGASGGASGTAAGVGGSAGSSGATSVAGSGAAATAGGSSGSGGSGGTAGARAGAGGTQAGASGTSGTAGTGGASGTTGNAGSGPGCTVGAWPAADPTIAGPYEVMTETNVGPAAGVGADGGAPVAYTLFRPKDLAAGGLCHPVVTWGNGTGSSPSLYKVLLGQLASHGFVVIASDSPQVSQGDPPPMVAGVTWVLEQNDDPASALYQRIDPMHVGATGHSQGGFATTTAGGDSHVTTIFALCGASNQRNLHGPALLFCGGADTTVPCSTIQNAYDSINNQPIMLAEYVSADHANWVTFRGTTPSPVEATVTAWMRVQLMGDEALRSWFYGPSCKLCTDDAWQVSQKMMDQ